MSSLTTIPALSTSAPEILPPLGSEVMEIVGEVKRSAHQLRSSTMALGYWGFRLRYAIEGMGGDWSTLGFELRTETGVRLAATEDEVRETLGVGRSTWYKALSIGQALRNLSLADMEAITVSNAELLLQVDPNLWGDFPWVAEAKRLSSGELAAKITERNRRHGNDREPMSYYRCKVPFTAKKFLEETVERFRLENGLSTTGEALELLVAEVHDRPSVLLAVRRSIKRLNWGRWRVSGVGGSEARSWLLEAELTLRRTYKSILGEGGAYAKDAKEVYPAESDEDRKGYYRWSRDSAQQSLRTAGEEAEDSPDLEEADGDMPPLSDADETDRDEDGGEDGEPQG